MTACADNIFLSGALSALPHPSATVILVAGDLLLLLMAGLWLCRRRGARKGAARDEGVVSGRSVEYGLVVKAMRLQVWRVDVKARTVTVESDYRKMSSPRALPVSAPFDRQLALVAPEDAARVREAFDDIFSGRREKIHLQLRKKSSKTGRVYWIEVHAVVAVRDAAGAPLGIVGASQRIDRCKQMEEELVRTRSKAGESDRLKRAFLANVSHEINTPLNAIVGFSDILPMAATEEERNRMIAIIHENNDKLLRIFDNIISLSCEEAGCTAGMEEAEPFEMSALVDEMRVRFSRANTNGSVRVEARQGAGNVAVPGNRSKVSAILSHFMDNALKFTRRGTVTVGTEWQPGRVLRVYVSDTGKGIAAADHERIFERFVKLDDFAQGMGLGLSVSRSLANSIGATVGVASQPGAGSTFWLDIPVPESHRGGVNSSLLQLIVTGL